MNITHDNDLSFEKRVQELRAIVCIKSGNYIIIKDERLHNNKEIILEYDGDDFENYSATYLNQKGISIQHFARPLQMKIIFLTKNFESNI